MILPEGVKLIFCQWPGVLKEVSNVIILFIFWQLLQEFFVTRYDEAEWFYDECYTLMQSSSPYVTSFEQN